MSMMENLPDQKPLSPAVSFAAWQWLTAPPPQAVRTEPVIAVLESLLTILRDQATPDHEVYESLRRAVRLLGAFLADKRR